MKQQEESKLSKYNHYYCDDERMILYNSYSGLKSIIMIEEKDLIKQVKTYIENENSMLDMKIFDILKRKRYIVEKSLDESDLVDKERSNAINEDKVVLNHNTYISMHLNVYIVTDRLMAKKMVR